MSSCVAVYPLDLAGSCWVSLSLSRSLSLYFILAVFCNRSRGISEVPRREASVKHGCVKYAHILIDVVCKVGTMLCYFILLKASDQQL